MADKGIESFQIELSPELKGEPDTFLQADVLIVNIPPRRNTNVEMLYPAIIENLVVALEGRASPKILFIGSTSVYPANNKKFSETDTAHPDKASGKALLNVEKLLKERFRDKLTILRFGGLVGYERGPISILRKNMPIKNPDSPLNLIHRDDCIAIIEKIVNAGFWGYTFNAVTDGHPLRREYYTHISQRYKLSRPQFVDEKKQAFKLIDNAYLKSTLAYNFIYPDPMEIV